MSFVLHTGCATLAVRLQSRGSTGTILEGARIIAAFDRAGGMRPTGGVMQKQRTCMHFPRLRGLHVPTPTPSAEYGEQRGLP